MRLAKRRPNAKLRRSFEVPFSKQFRVQKTAARPDRARACAPPALAHDFCLPFFLAASVFLRSFGKAAARRPAAHFLACTRSHLTRVRSPLTPSPAEPVEPGCTLRSNRLDQLIGQLRPQLTHSTQLALTPALVHSPQDSGTHALDQLIAARPRSVTSACPEVTRGPSRLAAAGRVTPYAWHVPDPLPSTNLELPAAPAAAAGPPGRRP